MDMALQQQALWHRRRDELDEAQACLEALLDRNPVHAPALRELGAVALLQGRVPEAKRLLLHTCRLRPSDADSWNNLGCAQERLGHWKEARQAFRRAAELAPGDSRLLGNLCVAHAACEDLESLCSTAESLLACAMSPAETLRSLRERCLEAGWIRALQRLEAWSVAHGWLAEERCIVPMAAATSP
jgi:Flp pilus assembly protein TadD